MATKEQTIDEGNQDVEIKIAGQMNYDAFLDKTVDQLEKGFHQDSSFRIEDLALEGNLIDRFSDQEKQHLFHELIHVETQLRFRAKQEIDIKEYEERFAEFSESIEEAFEKLKEMISSDFELLEVTKVLDSRNQIIVGRNGLVRIPSKLGKYKEIEVIGKGGFGLVCKAFDTKSGSHRALKFPMRSFNRNGDFIADVRNETNQSVGLDHANIVKTFGMEIVEPYAFVVQQFIDGMDLKTWLRTNRTLQEYVKMIAKIAAGLHYAHRNEIIHRDIKPANILVDQNDNPFIADFGMAFHDKDQLSLPSIIAGTPAYVAPEIAEGYVRQSDNRADIFSLGVILYEMLTGSRPFRGKDTSEILVEIRKKFPKSLRVRNPEIDPELERICLRCLEKRPYDRYLTARDLEDELRFWLSNPSVIASTDSRAPVFIPKGLHSYGIEDADFFLELLPGVRDRGNIPASVGFWVKRIAEPVPDDLRIPNGFIFGPSGSGKSSFVKAGLIPLIIDQVETIYIESTREDTEVRILKSLRKRFTVIPQEISLPDLFAGLASGKWRSGAISPKIFLVIDQFEQRLSREDQYEQSQLVQALKYCDGENLQSLMLVRDDFIFPCMRFADGLETQLLKAQNFQNLDLFDKQHAKKILIELGRAYQRLPKKGDLTEDENEFLDKSINQLSQGNHVVCVQLTLFAEMFKTRPWNLNELESVGGVQGVGERFLEATFGEESTNNRYRSRRKFVQAVLEELLPDRGQDIRGGMKPTDELISAAQCENNPQAFDDVTKILDQELRLISSTDPDNSGVSSVAHNKTSTRNVYYQLTHDYLVPSVRDWTTNDARKTFKGRVMLRFLEMVTLNKRVKNSLPTLVESILFLTLVPKRLRKQNTEFSKRLRAKVISQLTFTFVGFGFILALVISLMDQNRLSNAKRLYAETINCEPDAFSLALDRIKPLHNVVRRIIPKNDNQNENKDFEVDPNRSQIRRTMVRATIGEDIDLKDWIDTIQLILETNETEAKNLIPLIQSSRKILRIKEEIIRRAEPDRTNREKYAAINCALGDFQLASNIVSDSKNPSGRTIFIHQLGKYGNGWNDLFQNAERSPVVTDHLRYSLLLGFSLTLTKLPKQIDPGVVTAIRSYVQSKDPGVKSTASRLLKQTGLAESKENGTVTMIDIQGGELIREKDVNQEEFGIFFTPLKNETTVESFRISDSEITNRIFMQFKKATVNTDLEPLNWPDDVSESDLDKPVVNVSLVNAMKFCNWRSGEKNLTQCFDEISEGKWKLNEDADGFRLPTVHEFEFAAQGGASTVFSFGDISTFKYARSFACFGDPSKLKDEPENIKSFMPNRFGIFDMSGNVWEWSSPPHDFEAPFPTLGGAFYSKVKGLTRQSFIPEGSALYTSNSLGFRIAQDR